MWNPVKHRKRSSVSSVSSVSSSLSTDSNSVNDSIVDSLFQIFKLDSSHKINLRVFITIFVSILTLYLYILPGLNIKISLSPSSSSSLYTPNSKDLKKYNIEYHDLKDYTPHADGWNHNEKILFLVPLRDASPHLPMFIENMKNITYPHHLIDLAFLVSDTTDSTIKDLKKYLINIQNDNDINLHFGKINIYEKDFGQIIGQSFSDRHGFQAQGPRRKLMAIARNWLLSTALRPEHSWVYWRDIDVETVPATIIEDLMHHNKDVIVPNIWRPLPDWLGNEQPYDLNSWQESEGGLDLADKLDEDAVIVEGYQEYKTWRVHLGYVRDPFGDPEVEMELDGIGGVSILTKGSVFRSGAMFPAFSYLKHAETEGFGKLCKTMGYKVIGLPHYVIWHIYEPSVQDLQHMKWMAEEKKNRFKNAKRKRLYNKKWTEAFVEVDKDWDILKFNVFKNTDLRRYIDLDWNDVDGYLKLHEEDDEFKIFPELSYLDDADFDSDASTTEINLRYKNGYIPPNEIFNSFPLNNEANRNKFEFVRFDEDGNDNNDENNHDNNNEDVNSDENEDDDILNHNNNNDNDLINSNKNEINQERKVQELEAKKQIQEETQNQIEESKKEIQAEVDRVEEEHDEEVQKAKQKDMDPEKLEAELQRLKQIYEAKKKERQERKMKEESERLHLLAEERRKKRRLMRQKQQQEKELRKQMAVEKEIERREKMFKQQQQEAAKAL